MSAHGLRTRVVVVTGGNSGIGLALCKQLVIEDDCFVFLGSRDPAKGDAAIRSIIASAPAVEGRLEVLAVDVGDDNSVAAAAKSVKAKVGDGGVFGLVNNAGTGLAHEGVDGDTVMNVNWYGPQRLLAAFLPLLHPTEGRVVNVGSGAGPSYVKGLADAQKLLFCTCPPSVAVLEAYAKAAAAKPGFKEDRGVRGAYGLSKACLAAWTMFLATEYPNLTISACSPGFIDTAIVAGFGAKKTPEEGTVAIRHCLHKPLEGNGFYYGSDAVRSPYHFMRNPGEPAYDGQYPPT